MAAKQFLSVEDHGDTKRLHLHEENIKSLLLSEDVADKPVMVLAVAGEYRTGKSFLLNLMAQWLMASDKSHWLDQKSDIFSWQSGCEAHTNGMLMSHPIPVTFQSGEEGVLLLVDTQGTFDDRSTMTDSAKIFALSTLLSSVQIFNLTKNLNGLDIDSLNLFTEYGRLAKEADSTSGTPFEKLVFLIRDWRHTRDHQYGNQGGNEFLQRRLDSARGPLAQRNKLIKECFSSFSGFLLPFPGETVASGRMSDGTSEDMTPEFIESLEELMTMLFSPDNLQAKMNGSRPMTCRQLVRHIKTYTKLFQGDELPDPKSLLEAVADANNMAAVDEGLNAYMRQVRGLFGADGPPVDSSMMRRCHTRAKTAALRSLQARRLMKNPFKPEGHYSRLLASKIEEWFEAIENHRKMLDGHYKKALEKTSKLADDCVKMMETLLAPPERYWFNPVRYLPSREATVREKHKEVQQKVLEHFDKNKVTYGSYTAEESRRRVERELSAELRVALKENENKWMKIYVGIGIGVTCVVVGGAAYACCNGWTLEEILRAISPYCRDRLVQVVDAAGRILIRSLDEIDVNDLVRASLLAGTIASGLPSPI